MKIGLALSGGGALGAAHIGVLDELEKHDISLDAISGTSAGAIVAAIYASGGLDALNRFFDEAADLEIFNQKKPFKIITPARFFELLFEIVGKYCESEIENAKVPLTVVSTDIKTGEARAFSSGSMIAALKASCAYPGVFPIQRLDQSAYIDGGIACNLPSTYIREKVDFLIGSNLYGVGELTDESMAKLTRVRALLRSLDIIQKEIASLYARECEFCFDLTLLNLKWYSFNKILPIRERGTDLARAQMPNMLKTLQQKRSEG